MLHVVIGFQHYNHCVVVMVAQAILEKRAATKEKEHIWTYRTEEDASEHWKQEFGHLGK